MESIDRQRSEALVQQMKAHAQAVRAGGSDPKAFKKWMRSLDDG